MADPFTMMAVAGTAISAGGSILGGISANNNAKASAESQEIAAGQARAASQRASVQKSKEAQLVRSRQLAVAAKGGAAGDQSVIDLMADTAQEGALQAANIRYEGEDQARVMRDQAAATRLQGKQALIAGFIDAGSTVLSGASQWGGKFKKTPSASSANIPSWMADRPGEWGITFDTSLPTYRMGPR